MCEHGKTTIIKTIGREGQLQNSSVDDCISSLVYALNRSGISTIACCCGHNVRPGNIALRDGRELIIAPDYETGRVIDKAFPPIFGQRKTEQITLKEAMFLFETLIKKFEDHLDDSTLEVSINWQPEFGKATNLQPVKVKITKETIGGEDERS